MIPIDLKGKVALVTGVGDNVGFAWHIAKTLQAAGATLFFAVHPRLVSFFTNYFKEVLWYLAKNLNFFDRGLRQF